jgi:hypothetical protein
MAQMRMRMRMHMHSSPSQRCCPPESELNSLSPGRSGTLARHESRELVANQRGT